MNPSTSFANRQLARKQYMDTLQLSIANDKLNMKANQSYDRNTMELLEPIETLSAEEKLEDEENMKKFVYNALKPVTKDANSIVQNIGKDDLIFVAQNINTIIELIKYRYQYAIPGAIVRNIISDLKKFQYRDYREFTGNDSIYDKSDFLPPVTKDLKNISPTSFTTANDDDEEPPFTPLKTPSTPASPTKNITNFTKLTKAKQDEYLQKRSLEIGRTKAENEQIYRTFLSEIQIKGKGLNKVTPHNIDTSKTIEPMKSYIPFGRYVINRHKLNDNILMLKHMKGGSVSTIPTTHISDSLSKTIQQFIESQLPPTYDMISHLSNDDKELLHKIAKICHILDKLNIPTPNLDKDQQDNHRFEVLKGEINAGNDNKEMIKEFKLLLLKFIHKNKLPRRQAQEILIDLVALGY